MTVGDSRVGKSTVSKLLIDLLLQQEKKVKVYDHDNRQRLKAYEEVAIIEKLDFFEDETDKFLMTLNKREFDVLLIDMPGQYINKICQYINQVELFSLLADYKWKLTFLQPISHRLDCLDYLKTLLELAAFNANYVVVKNQHFGTRFTEYQSIQHKLALVGGVDVELTGLHREMYEVLERRGKPYSMASNDMSIYLIYRQYIHQWIKKFSTSIFSKNIAIQYLGLEAK
ncbi:MULTISPECIES: ATP/GTP-binding protein [Nostocales]|uniref:ATP/GTP-binding protein n=1 Tax=Nostocales TaxID=1161 RepID=UPI0018EF7A04|nr:MULTISPECIES: ATP/GTP-binding protein [Nostocales]